MISLGILPLALGKRLRLEALSTLFALVSHSFSHKS